MNEDRRPNFKNIGPILNKNYKLYGRSNKSFNIENLDDAKVYNRISTVLNDVREVFLRENEFKNLTYYNKHYKGLEALLVGKTTLWASSDWEKKINLKKLNKDTNLIKPVFILFNKSNYILFNKDTDPQIIKNWNKALRQIKTDGTIEIIAKKWREKLNLNIYFIKEIDAIGIIE